MKRKVRISAIILSVTVLACLTWISDVSADPTWNDFGNWNPMSFTGDWTHNTIGKHFAYGPVVADIDNDGQQEIIVYDLASIRVYPHDAESEDDTMYTIDLPQARWNEGYRIKSPPSVGDVNGDGVQDIVFTCDLWVNSDGPQEEPPYTYNIRSFQSYVFACDGTDGSVLDDIQINLFKANTPALADVAVLDYDPLNPTFEDGRMEIIISGFGATYTNLTGENPQQYTHNQSVYWRMKVLKLTAQGLLSVIATREISDSDTMQQDYDDMALNNASYTIPAVGDMDGDGMKEIVWSCMIGYGCWTFDASDNTLDEQFTSELPNPPYADDRGFHAIGPILADIDNNGSLEAIIMEYTGDGNSQTVVHALDIDGEEVGNWPLQVNSSQYRYPLESPIAGDYRNDGNVGPSFHTQGTGGDDYLTFYQGNSNPLREAIAIPVGTPGVMMASAFLGYDDDAAFLTGGSWNNAKLHAISVSGGIEDELNFTGDAVFSSPIVNDLDNDGDFEVILSTLVDPENDDELAVRIWSLGNVEVPEGLNPFALTECGQLKNGPRHTGLYAQPYSGTLPLGTTYWRDRVIIVDDVIVNGAHMFSMHGETPTVIEFNDADLVMRTYGWPVYLGPYPIVFKGNFEGAEWEIRWDVPPPPPPPPPPDDHETIQAGIDASEDGDTVLVQPSP